jgi:hypothetical protein
MYGSERSSGLILMTRRGRTSSGLWRTADFPLPSGRSRSSEDRPPPQPPGSRPTRRTPNSAADPLGLLVTKIELCLGRLEWYLTVSAGKYPPTGYLADIKVFDDFPGVTEPGATINDWAMRV